MVNALPSGRCTLLLNSFVLKGHHLGFNLTPFCVLKKSPSFYELWPGRLLLRNKVVSTLQVSLLLNFSRAAYVVSSYGLACFGRLFIIHIVL